MVVFAGVQPDHAVAWPIALLFALVALVLTCIGLVDKYIIHRGQAVSAYPKLRLFARIFGVAGLLGIVVALLHARFAVRPSHRTVGTKSPTRSA